MNGSLLPPSLLVWLVAIEAAAYILAVPTILYVLRQRKEPMAMLSWILGVLLLPPLVVPLYYFIGERRVHRRVRRRRRRREYIARAIATAAVQAEESGSALRFSSQALAPQPVLDESLSQLAEVSNRLGRFPLTTGNKVEVFTSAQATYDAILRSIDEARGHVHLEYYIFRQDDTGKLFRDRLAAKARGGVEVRLLLDGVGSWSLRRGFFRPLIEAGGRVGTFLPAIPFGRPWHINCRNHRKIVVVDGEVAYTGSQNIGNEYRGLLRRLGPWQDTHLRLEGPAAIELQEVFVEDWYFATGEDLTGRKYLRRQPARGGSLVQIVPSGPDQRVSILPPIFASAIALAKKSIHISMPYFVPDPGLILALQSAAWRGVHVEVLVPSRTDSRLVLWAGRSYYQELRWAGVRIYEFDHGMLHSKTITIDGKWSLTGSANIDVRSFLLNFEATASVFDEQISAELEAVFIANRSASREIPLLKDGDSPLFPSILEGAARLFSPLL